MLFRRFHHISKLIRCGAISENIDRDNTSLAGTVKGSIIIFYNSAEKVHFWSGNVKLEEKLHKGNNSEVFLTIISFLFIFNHARNAIIELK